MADSLKIFGIDYTNVDAIQIQDNNYDWLTFINENSVPTISGPYKVSSGTIVRTTSGATITLPLGDITNHRVMAAMVIIDDYANRATTYSEDATLGLFVSAASTSASGLLETSKQGGVVMYKRNTETTTSATYGIVTSIASNQITIGFPGTYPGELGFKNGYTYHYLVVGL